MHEAKRSQAHVGNTTAGSMHLLFALLKLKLYSHPLPLAITLITLFTRHNLPARLQLCCQPPLC